MVHVAQTLKDFGPIQNYSTFNFESAMGMFSKSRTYHFGYIDQSSYNTKEETGDSR